MDIKKLPVLATVRAAYRAVREHAGALVLLSRLTAITAVVAFVVVYGLMQLGLQSDEALRQEFLALPVGERVANYAGLSVLIVTLGMFFIIVRWHRLLVLDVEPRKTKGRVLPAAALYIVRGTLLGALGGAIAVVCSMLPISLSRSFAMPHDARWWLSFASVLVAVALALFVVARTSLILPAGAVGAANATLRGSWALTRGNGWRLAAGSALASGPAFLTNIVINGLSNRAAATAVDAMSAGLVFAVSLVLLVVTAVIQASFLSYAYRYLAGRDAGAE